MKIISLYPNPNRDPNLTRTAKVIETLLGFPCELRMERDFARIPSLTPYQNRLRFVAREELFSADLLITLGGDGTILSVAEEAAKAGTPIFGINFGHVGFMTSLEEKELAKLPLLLEKELPVSSRMMLECTVGDKTFYALNEFVITPERGGVHMVDLDLFTGRKKLCRFRADGLIFNTPTGSTGYSFSAGGAVQDVNFDSIGVKAVSSYLLINAHHMIFSPETVFSVKGASEGGKLTVCADGKTETVVTPADTVKIRRARHRLKLIFPGPQSNLEVFFRKF